MPIPLYRHDGALIDWISPKRAEKLFEVGRAKLVRHKKGTINRVVLHRLAGEPEPMKITDCMGKPYSYEQRLQGGNRCWRLKSLTGTGSETNLVVSKNWIWFRLSRLPSPLQRSWLLFWPNAPDL